MIAPDCEWLPIQLPGREERFGEALLEDVSRLADEVTKALVATLSPDHWSQTILLGYSFGALLAFETALRIERLGLRPLGLLACAREAPQQQPIVGRAEWPDAALLQHLKELGGLPEEILAEPEFLDLLLPVLRADLRANERSAWPATYRLRSSIALVLGDRDPFTPGARKGWSERSEGTFFFAKVDGGHFFVHEKRAETFARLRELLFALESAQSEKTERPMSDARQSSGVAA